MKEEFRFKDFRPDTLAVLRQAEAILGEYSGAITLRQLYYQFIGRDVLPASWVDPAYNKKKRLEPDTKNTEKNYKRLGDLLSNGRLAGLIDWDDIEDRVRRPVIWSEFDNIRKPVEYALRSFRLPRWREQECYVEVWVEKDALASVLEPVAARWHVTLMVNRGYSSQSAMHDSGKRFRQRSDLDCHLLYIGDHDPSGEDMVRDVQDRLSMFEAQVQVEKVALTMEQVRRYKLPPNPAKLTDSRASAYIAEHGNKSWEVDALDQKVLVKMIEKAILQYVDQDVMLGVIEEENACKEKLKTFLEGMKE